MRSDCPVFAQPSLGELETVYVNAGSPGFLIGIDPGILFDLTNAVLIDIAVD
jgi:prolyl-tRNA editing enzyme YbaK/EbsC (Cys-tRNA(Pro) deacylase)